MISSQILKLQLQEPAIQIRQHFQRLDSRTRTYFRSQHSTTYKEYHYYNTNADFIVFLETILELKGRLSGLKFVSPHPYSLFKKLFKDSLLE